MNAYERTISDIDKFLAMEGRKDRYGTDDLPVLKYIRKQITPEAIEDRLDQELGNPNHLLEVAKMRLAPYQEVLKNND